MFDMEPKDAVAYLKSKGYVISDRWHEVLTDAHAKAFTVAKAMRLDILETIRGKLDEALANGMTLEQVVAAAQAAGVPGDVIAAGVAAAQDATAAGGATTAGTTVEPLVVPAPPANAGQPIS